MQNRRHTTSYRPPPVLSLALQEELRAALAEAAARNEPWTGGGVGGGLEPRPRPPIFLYLCASFPPRLTQSIAGAPARHPSALAPHPTNPLKTMRTVSVP